MADRDTSTTALDSSDSHSSTQRLLEAAVDAFAENGFEEVRIAQVARRAGLTTGAIYSRWPSKEQMLIEAVGHAVPKRRLQRMSAAEMPAADKLALLGSDLLELDDPRLRDLIIEACVRARRDTGFRSGVSRYLREESAALTAIVSQGKSEGFIDPDLSTAAIVLICQALGLGVHLVLLSELEYRQAPTPDEWNTVLERLITAIGRHDTSSPAAS